jgi:hypothetical protein
MKSPKKRFLRIILTVSLIFILGTILFVRLYLRPGENKAPFKFNQHSSYWPTNGWKFSTPEKQGMDSETLITLFDEIKEKPPLTKLKHKMVAKIKKEPVTDSYPIYRLIIIRNGFIVVDASSRFLVKDGLRPLHSVTKSFTSALFGIALNGKHIDGIDQPVLGFFPEISVKKDRAQKEAITIRHLLTMSCGLEWPEWEAGYGNPENPLHQMRLAGDWAAYVLDRPVVHEPGAKFNYNSGCSLLLGRILQKHTGSMLDFAQESLLNPLGIKEFLWRTDSNGVPNSSYGLVMKGHDIAKFGFLFLKGGFWDGRQIVPKKWVEESTQPHIRIPGLLGLSLENYGYQWYIRSYGFHALGVGGQYIFVIPKLEMVIVFISKLAAHETFDPIDLVEDIILPSAKSPNPLPDNPKARATLKRRIESF